jgi:hypothetical protein
VEKDDGAFSEFIMNKSYKPQIFVLFLCSTSANALTLWAKDKVPN